MKSKRKTTPNKKKYARLSQKVISIFEKSTATSSSPTKKSHTHRFRVNNINRKRKLCTLRQIMVINMPIPLLLFHFWPISLCDRLAVARPDGFVCGNIELFLTIRLQFSGQQNTFGQPNRMPKLIAFGWKSNEVTDLFSLWLYFAVGLFSSVHWLVVISSLFFARRVDSWH